MDEASRKLERDLADDDAAARLRLANAKLREGDPARAAELLAGVAGDLAATTRAVALARLGNTAHALDLLEGMAGTEGALDLAAVSEVLTRLLGSAEPLAKARVARIARRLGGPEPLLAGLRADSAPLVRLALVEERRRYGSADRSVRVYGSHGPDFETGFFLAFEASLETRLELFSLDVFGAVAWALAQVATDPGTVLAEHLRPACGEGYGLGGARTPARAILEDAAKRLEALDLLPWKLRVFPLTNYDVIQDEEGLAQRLAKDVRGHPARGQPAADSSVLARFLAGFPLPAPTSSRERLAPLLQEARARYGRAGARALEIAVAQGRALL